MERAAKFLVKAGVIFPSLVSAQLKLKSPVTKIEGFLFLACRAADWLFVFASALSVILVVVAAFKYLTSGGSEEKVAEAHRMLTWIAVGVAVVIFAWSVPVVVNELVGGEGDIEEARTC